MAGLMPGTHRFVRTPLLCLAFKIHLSILVQAVLVCSYANIQDRVELVAICTIEIQLHERLNLRPVVHLIPIKAPLQIV